MSAPAPARSAALSLALLLAACAAPPAPPSPADAGAGPLVVPAKPPGGLWVVTDFYPSGRVPAGTTADSLVGQRVRLDAEEAGDLLGRTCAMPAFRRVEMTEAALLGGLPRAREFPPLRRALTAVEVTCGDEPFGTFAAWKDGSLLARSGGLVARLERAEAVPARAAPVAMPVAMPAAPPAAADAPAPEPAKPAARPSAGGAPTLVYLASYGSEKQARLGWDRLRKASATLAGLTPATKPVDLGDKGKFVRLYATTNDAVQAGKLCGEVRKQVPDCGAKRG